MQNRAMRGLTALQKLSQNNQRDVNWLDGFWLCMRCCSYEIATLLLGLLCARIARPLRAICTVAIGARLECYVVLSRAIRQSDERVLCDGCDHFCDRADLVYPKRRQTSAGSASVVADAWNVGRRCLVWIPAFSFSKAGVVGSNNCSSLTEP